MPKQLTYEEQAELNRRADRLSSLLNTPGWLEMEATSQRKIVKLRRAATNLALASGGADQRRLDVLRGTIAGINWFIGVPAHAQGTLEEYLREQGIEIEEDEHEFERDGRGTERAGV